MKISEAIATILIACFSIFIGFFLVAMFISLAVAICAIPIYGICLIFGFAFRWYFAVLLAAVLFFAYAIKTM